VQCGDVEVEKKIEEKITQFITWAEKHPNRKGQVQKKVNNKTCTSFFLKKSFYEFAFSVDMPFVLRSEKQTSVMVR